MTVEDHLKIAQNELQKAADAAKLDTNQLRTDLDNIKHMTNLQLARLTEELRLVKQQQEISADSRQRQQVSLRVNGLQKQIADKQRELSDEIRRMSDLIRQREKDISAILQQARIVAPS